MGKCWGNFTAVREMSGISMKIREMPRKKWPKTFLKMASAGF